MRKTSAELRQQARQALLGRYGTACGGILLALLFMIVVSIAVMFVWLVVGAVTFAAGIRMTSGLLLAVCFVVLGFLTMVCFITGEIRICMRICAGEESEMADLFFGLTHHPLRFGALWLIFYLGIGLLQMLPGFLVQRSLWLMTGHLEMLLLAGAGNIVLLIVVSLLGMRYLLNVIAMVDHPELSIMECFHYSSVLLQGSYKRLFGLWPGFVGMILLGYTSFGIGFIWITPYLISVLICFYFDLKEEHCPAAAENGRYETYSWGGTDGN